MTLKELVDDFEKLCLSHKQVKEFVYCQPALVNEQAKAGRKYFLIVMAPSTTVLGSEIIARSFNITCMDIIDKTTNNKLQIQSDCEGILNDLVNFLKFQDTEVSVNVSQELSLFEENWGDFCAGASMVLTFETDNTGSCDLPFNPIV
jgi:hypothetical protein